jgi:hypothetical protein
MQPYLAPYCGWCRIELCTLIFRMILAFGLLKPNSVTHQSQHSVAVVI